MCFRELFVTADVSERGRGRAEEAAADGARDHQRHVQGLQQQELLP